MRSAAPRTPSSRRKTARRAPVWIAFWPLLLGIIATPFAVRSASVLALTGPSALRVLYPYVVLVQSQAAHFSPEQTDTISQWILYGQFPVYGLVWLVAGRLLKGSAGPLAVLILHVGGVAAALFESTR